MIVGQPTTLTFSLVAPSGVTYSSPTVTVEENPWATSSALTDNGDGTYSITITPDRETRNQIRLKVIQDGKTYYHTLETLVSGDFKLAVQAMVNSTAGGAVSIGFIFTDNANNKKVWNLGTSGVIIDPTSLKATGSNGVTVAAPTFATRNTMDATLSSTLSWGTGVDQGVVTWEFDAIHPLSGVKHHFSYPADVYNTGMTATWVSTAALPQYNETILQFTLKYASGNPVKNVKYNPAVAAHVISGPGTIAPEIVVIDESQGLYGVKVTATGTTAVTVTPRFVVGNSLSGNTVAAKAFSVITIATATIPAMYNNTRTIGIVLKDVSGFITDATITGISAGTYLDATTGPWTVTDTAKGLYKVQVKGGTRGMPSNTNDTPYLTDKVNVTYTRAGKTYVQPMDIRYYFANVKLAVGAITTAGGAVQLTPASTNPTPTAQWTFSAPAVIGMDGVTAVSGGTMANNIGSTGNIQWTSPAITAAGELEISGTAAYLGTTYYYWSDPFVPTHQFTLKWTPTSTAQSVFTGPYSSIPAFTFNPIEVTIKDDLGGLITGAQLLASPAPTWTPTDSFSGFTPTGGGAWPTALVPKTDGSDGKYLLKLNFGGYYYGVTRATFYFYASITSTDHPGVVSRLSLTIPVNGG